MATMLYTLGPLAPLRELYPEPKLMDLTKPQPQTLGQVVELFTKNSLTADRIDFD